MIHKKSKSLHAKAAIGARLNLRSYRGRFPRSRACLEIGVRWCRRLRASNHPRRLSYKQLRHTLRCIGDRRIVVLNFTDKAGGEDFTARDLELLQAIAPQIAVAIDRTTLRDKAGEYEQLSVTDPLTGLLNRRYLEERLAEEITRSKRHRFSMSLMMWSRRLQGYNDSFGHRPATLR